MEYSNNPTMDSRKYQKLEIGVDQRASKELAALDIGQKASIALKDLRGESNYRKKPTGRVIFKKKHESFRDASASKDVELASSGSAFWKNDNCIPMTTRSASFGPKN